RRYTLRFYLTPVEAKCIPSITPTDTECYEMYSSWLPMKVMMLRYLRPRVKAPLKAPLLVLLCGLRGASNGQLNHYSGVSANLKVFWRLKLKTKTVTNYSWR